MTHSLLLKGKLVPIEKLDSSDGKTIWVISKKTKNPCFNFAKGKCTRKNCKFSHAVCKYHQNNLPHPKGRCKFVHMRDCFESHDKKSCPLRHIVKSSAPVLNTELCPKFAKTGLFTWGCELSHDVCEDYHAGKKCDGKCNKHHMKDCESTDEDHDIDACNFRHLK